MLLISSLTTTLFSLLLQTDGSDFKDLGKWLVGGFIFALAAGVGITLLRQRWREKKSPATEVISITGRHRK